MSNLLYILFGYLGAINLLAFLLMGFDKWMATGKRWRVSEARLWIFAFVGGSLGTLFGIFVFRHKIRKMSFLLVFFLILLLHASLTFFVWWYIMKGNVFFS